MDVAYIDAVLSNGSGGSFEFFAVATTNVSSGRYDGNYAPAPATLTLLAAASTGKATGLLTYDPSGTRATATPNFTTSLTVADFTDSGTGAGTDVPFANGNTVSFTDAGLTGGARTISIDPAGVAPAAVNVTNTAGTYTFTGSGTTGITGSGTLVKTGGGTLQINYSNSYSGGTTISGGTVSIAIDFALGTGNIVLNGGTLAVTSTIFETTGPAGSDGPVRSVQLASGTGGTIALGNATGTGRGDLALGGDLSGPGPLAITGIGSVTIRAEANGDTIGPVSIATNTTFDLQTTSAAVPYFAVGDTVTAASTINGTLYIGGGNGGGNTSSVYAAALRFTTGATYNGTGTVVLDSSSVIETDGASTSAFAVTINPTLDLTGGAIRATAGKSIVLNGGVEGDEESVAIGAAPVLSNGSIDPRSAIGKAVFNGPGTYTGQTNVNGGTLVVDSSLASSIVAVAAPTTLAVTGGNVTYYPTLAGTGTLAGQVELGGAITAGSGATSADSIGRLTLSNTLNASSGSVYAVKLNGAAATPAANGSGGSGVPGTVSDELVLSGINTPANLTVSPVLTSAIAAGQYSFLIGTTTGTQAGFGSLGGESVTLPSTFPAGSVASLSSGSDGGGDYDLFLDITVAAPEPTGLLLAGIAAGPLIFRRSQRRRTRLTG